MGVDFTSLPFEGASEVLPTQRKRHHQIRTKSAASHHSRRGTAPSVSTLPKACEQALSCFLAGVHSCLAERALQMLSIQTAYASALRNARLRGVPQCRPIVPNVNQPGSLALDRARLPIRRACWLLRWQSERRCDCRDRNDRKNNGGETVKVWLQSAKGGALSVEESGFAPGRLRYHPRCVLSS